MNKARREALQGALDSLNAAKEIIETCRDEEQEYLDNMPEGFREGEKGSKAEEAINNMEDCSCTVENVIYELESIVQYIDETISNLESAKE